MKTQSNRLTFSQQFFIATMLFGLFFGAGNLIFPIFLGSQAGRNVWPAIVGLLITGVGIPLLGVAAQGISRSNGLQEMAGRVSPRYSIFFTCALYLTIGPFFAIPRAPPRPSPWASSRCWARMSTPRCCWRRSPACSSPPCCSSPCVPARF
ncbi:MAG: branched-chain amino acid transport system II carrier protein [Vescimonas sp.]